MGTPSNREGVSHHDRSERDRGGGAPGVPELLTKVSFFLCVFTIFCVFFRFWAVNQPSFFRCFSGKIPPPELTEPAISSNWPPIGPTAPFSTPHTRSVFLIFSCAVLGRTDPTITTQVISQLLSQKHTVSTTLSRLCLLRRFSNHGNTGSDRSRS